MTDLRTHISIEDAYCVLMDAIDIVYDLEGSLGISTTEAVLNPIEVISAAQCALNALMEDRWRTLSECKSR